MKVRMFLLLLWFPSIISAQDTIFVKNGDVIPSVIVSKDNTAVKYMQYPPAESPAVYTIFLSDIRSIHYADGKEDNIQTGEEEGAGSKSAFELAGNYNIGRVSIGTGLGFFNRSMSDNLDEFWAAGSNKSVMGGNPLYFPVEVKMAFVTSQSRRHWVMSGLQVFALPSDAIHSTSDNGLDEIRIGSYSMNIILNYGYAFNNKKNLVAIIDPGIDMLLMNGYLKFDGIRHNLFSGVRTGMHLATGIDWIFSRRFHANFRAGYRFSKAFDEDHFDNDSPTGFAHYTISGEDVMIKWSGFYASAGLAASFYFNAAKFAQSRVRP